jgi:hypothetical protein
VSCGAPKFRPTGTLSLRRPEGSRACGICHAATGARVNRGLWIFVQLHGCWSIGRLKVCPYQMENARGSKTAIDVPSSNDGSVGVGC